MNEQIDFTYEEMARIAFPGNDLDGAVCEGGGSMPRNVSFSLTFVNRIEYLG